MRRRTDAELQSPERLAVLSGNPQTTPRAIREYIREHYVTNAVARLYRIGMGEESFTVHVYGGPEKPGIEVQVPASASVQRAALAEVVKYGLPAQVGLADDDGNTVPGVIALPALEMDAVQQRIQAERARALPKGEPGSEDEEEGEEYIEIPDEESEE